MSIFASYASIASLASPPALTCSFRLAPAVLPASGALSATAATAATAHALAACYSLQTLDDSPPDTHHTASANSTSVNPQNTPSPKSCNTCTATSCSQETTSTNTLYPFSLALGNHHIDWNLRETVFRNATYAVSLHGNLPSDVLADLVCPKVRSLDLRLDAPSPLGQTSIVH